MMKALRRFLRRIYFGALSWLPGLRMIPETHNTAIEVTPSSWFLQKLSRNRKVPWPVHYRSLVDGWKYIRIGVNTAPGISFGNYIFATESCPISFGDYTVLAPNVCIAGINHDPENILTHTQYGGVQIGAYCWIGMNAVVLPGVTLGDHTVVGAGAVVTKSFHEGYCIIAGNPARLIRRLDKSRVKESSYSAEYIGFRRIRKTT